MKWKVKRATHIACYIGILFVMLVWISSMPDPAAFFPDTKGVIATGSCIMFTALPFLLLIAIGVLSQAASFYICRLLLAVGMVGYDFVAFVPEYLMVSSELISNRWPLILTPFFQTGILSIFALLYLFICRTDETSGYSLRHSSALTHIRDT